MKKEHTIDTVFALMLFCIFTASVLFVLISGASAYKAIAGNMQASFEERTCVSYISAKIHAYDSNEKGVEVNSYDGITVLELKEKYDDISYSTYVYCHDGLVKELFSESALGFDAESGLEVMEAESLSLKKTDNLIEISCTAGGKKSDLKVSLRSEKGGAAYE